MVDAFQKGTGWLGWTPEVVMNTPIPQLLMALEGYIDKVRMTTPGVRKSDATPRKRALDRGAVARKARSWITQFNKGRG